MTTTTRANGVERELGKTQSANKQTAPVADASPGAGRSQMGPSTAALLRTLANMGRRATELGWSLYDVGGGRDCGDDEELAEHLGVPVVLVELASAVGRQGLKVSHVRDFLAWMADERVEWSDLEAAFSSDEDEPTETEG